ncbi:COX assembly mitochondrial protein 2 homolog [Sitodiplosis mosellana]|uniref:COX assembly mitochondrial protein 2 homolog n=1 Tax=Sitodiplosis mosellana TaxID=263140 RepID=UPI002444807B|nr:COX assembly mitochondrial protein 2 homolog [Sitodiplosis mosellana]
MHPDLSPHLHTDECNKLVQELFACRKDNLFLKFFGKCNTPYDRMLACMKQERLARRAKNAETARQKQELVREKVKKDKTDYDELLKQYRKEARPSSN